MPAITVRNVPEQVRNELAARAARAGQSMQEYLREHLVDVASRPSVADALVRTRARLLVSGTALDRNAIVEAVRAGRDE